MAIPPFNLGYPPDGSSLGQTKSTLRNNIDGTFLTLAVDHIDNNGNPGAQPAGFHNVIHMVPQAADPGVEAGYGQLYSKTVATDPITDQALFWESGTGLIAQLTANFTPSANVNGFTYIAGGLIIQWGILAGSSLASIPVLFTTANMDFPANCFYVTAIPIRAATSPGSDFSTVIVTGSVSKTGFTIGNIGGHTMAGWYWMAIGN